MKKTQKQTTCLKTEADHFFEAIQYDNRADQKMELSGTIWSRSGRLEKTILGEVPPLPRGVP